MNIIVLINFLFHYLTFWYNTKNSSFAASRKEFIYDKKKNYIYTNHDAYFFDDLNRIDYANV